MITLTAKINIISGDNSALSLTSNSLLGNNISSDLGKIIGSKYEGGANPFILGVSELGSGATFESKESFENRGSYFIGSELSDSEGNFPTSQIITVTSTNEISSISIEFDKINNRHPYSISINGVEYFDDDPIFTLQTNTSEKSHTITINNWNTPNAPLVIMGIYTEISIKIDKRNLISLNRSIFDRSDVRMPSYGILSNTGNIEFKDLDGEVRDYAERLLLVSDLKVKIFINNTSAKCTEQIGDFETREWDYDNDNRVVSVSLKDDLEEWQDISVEGFPYKPQAPYYDLPNGTMADLYKKLYRSTPSKYNMLSFNELDEKTRTVLESTQISYPILKKASLWAQWDKLCKVCGLYIYKNNKARTVCTYTNGS